MESYFETEAFDEGSDHGPAGGRSGCLAPGCRMYQRMKSRSTRLRGLRPSGCTARAASPNCSHSLFSTRTFAVSSPESSALMPRA